MNPKFYIKRNYFKTNWNIIFVAVVLIFISSCQHKVEPFKIEEFKIKGEIGFFVNYSKTAISFMGDSINPALLLSSKGDMFWIQFENPVFFIPDWDDSNSSYKVYYDNDILYVNDEIRSISISDTNQLGYRLERLIKNDLSQLQFICIETDIPETCYPYMEEIAKVKPDVGFFIDVELSEITSFVEYFNPRYLILFELKNEDINLITHFPNLEMLYLEDPEVSQPLPNFPKLKQVFLILSQPLKNGELLANNKQIEKLNFQYSDELEMSILADLDNLKELVIGFPDSISISEYNMLNRLNKLEVLSIVAEKKIYDPGRIQLPDLRWMAFDSYTTQEEFSEFISKHPKLEVIEIVDNKNITDLGLLSNLNNLSGLTITDSITDLVSVQALKKLKYLSLPSDFLDEESARENLQKALPEARITVNDGFLCMGSGWLLLLIPLVIIFRFLLRRKTNIPLTKSILLNGTTTKI